MNARLFISPLQLATRATCTGEDILLQNEGDLLMVTFRDGLMMKRIERFIDADTGTLQAYDADADVYVSATWEAFITDCIAW